MSVNLADRIPDLKAAVNPPGRDAFPTSVDGDWLSRLRNAFWEAVLEGVLTGYVIDESGIVTPVSGSVDMGRDTQQLIVLFAAWKVVLQSLLDVKASFIAKAGPVTFEQTQSATILRELATQIRDQLNRIIAKVSKAHVDVTAFDAVIERTWSIATGQGWELR